jgi:anti-sigma B factor antagonist
MSRDRSDDQRSGVVVGFQTRPIGEPEPPVSVALRRFGGWTVVEVSGEMDIQAMTLFTDLFEGNAAHVVFELRGVTFIDACGLRILLECRSVAMAAGGCVRLVAPSRQVGRLLRLTGTYPAFSIFHSLLDAVTSPVTEVPQEVS